MMNLNQFLSQKLTSVATSLIKGGANSGDSTSLTFFCEWYIGIRDGKNISSGQMKKFMKLDAILKSQGLSSALDADPKLLAKYGF